jgi:hypothetical protein
LKLAAGAAASIMGKRMKKCTRFERSARQNVGIAAALRNARS